MLNEFKSYIKQEQLFSSKEKVLLTVSGGMDSILMCELFHLAKLKFGIAHCNFQLRGNDSSKDEAFVKSIAKRYNVEFHSIKFDTESFSKTNKISTQIAARELRYEWFDKIKKQYQYNYIATAHHQNDSIETILINITRGTGISGLHGILPKQGAIIRPLLFTTKEEIEAYIKKNKIKYREDKSNASEKYIRNKIRHQIIPRLKEINPSLEKTFSNNIDHIRDVETIFKKEINRQRLLLVKKTPNSTSEEYRISIKALKNLSPINTYLYELLSPFNFNATTVNKLVLALNGISGKQFISETHLLIKDRDFLIIEKKDNSAKKKIPSIIKIKENQKKITFDGGIITVKKTESKEIIAADNIAQLDFNKLTFPLEIRKWESGDVFYPLGMKGKKKLSDFFIDKKLSLPKKSNTWILTSAGKVVWIMGLRIDNRFKISNKTQKVITISLQKN